MGGLNDNISLVICQCFSFGGKGCREPASSSQQHTQGLIGVQGLQQSRGKATRKTPN